jgi:hypothetical protein
MARPAAEVSPARLGREAGLSNWVKLEVIGDERTLFPDNEALIEATLARLLERGEVLVVLGSSLTVMSGLRFVRHNAKQQRPVVIINRGVTRGDELASELATAQGRRGWLREAKQRLEKRLHLQTRTDLGHKAYLFLFTRVPPSVGDARRSDRLLARSEE